jgi:hypothetical protein
MRRAGTLRRRIVLRLRLSSSFFCQRSFRVFEEDLAKELEKLEKARELEDGLTLASLLLNLYALFVDVNEC